MRHLLRALLLLPALATTPYATGASGIPQVHFAVFRLNLETYEIVGVAEFSQPFRKGLPPPGYEEFGDVQRYLEPPGDFGLVRYRSRLTAQQVVYSTLVWAGTGHLVEPPPGEFTSSFLRGLDNPPPASLTIQCILDFGDPAPVWDAVRHTEPILRLAATGDPYEVFIADHFYAWGEFIPATGEWFVIAFTRPPAPEDVGVVGVVPSGGPVTRNVPTPVTATLHNFGDAPVDVGALLIVRDAMGTEIHRDLKRVESFFPETSRAVTFEPFVPRDEGEVHLEVQVSDRGGNPRPDAFGDNDRLSVALDVTPLPVFRLDPGVQVPDGRPVDLDGDGDLDVLGIHGAVYENLGKGRFHDIYERIDWVRDQSPNGMEVADLNGDGLADLLLYLNDGILTLQRTPDGRFVKMTGNSGLTGQEWLPGAILDADGDADQDLILILKSPSYPRTGHLLLNDGTGRFSSPPDGFLDEENPVAYAPEDYDGDGDVDLFAVHWQAPSRLYRNDGAGHFTRIPGPWDTADIGGQGATWTDLDGDDDPDLILAASNYQATARLFENRGGDSFADITGWMNDPPAAFRVDTGDLTGDGLPEILFTDASSGTFRLFRNLGGRLEDMSGTVIGVPRYSGPRLWDLDEDGDLDIVAGTSLYRSGGADPEWDPTPVRISGLRATREGSGAILRWRVVDALGHAGFHVHRQGAGAARERLTTVLLPPAPDHEFRDPAPPAGNVDYWVEEVARNGARSWFGPIPLAAGAIRIGAVRPNPSRGETVLRLSLPTAEHVRVTLHDIRGREIGEIQNGFLPAGDTELVWNGRLSLERRAPAGMYFLRIRAGSVTEVRKVLRIE